MSHQSVPILETILKAWTDGFRAMRDMPLVAACALVLLVLVATGVYFATGAILLNSGRSAQEWVESPAWLTFVMFSTSIRIVLLAPLFMAVHRYVIGGAVARQYPLNPLRPSYLRYVGMALAVYAALKLPEMIGVLLAPARTLLLFDLLFALLTTAMMITVAVVVLGKIALFPAIAVNARSASWRDTPLADAGNLMRTIAVMIAIIGPAQLAAWLVHGYLPAPHWPNGNEQLVRSLALVLVDLPTLCALAAAMARIYLAVGASAEPARAASAGQQSVA
jgi:hypothetical protein